MPAAEVLSSGTLSGDLPFPPDLVYKERSQGECACASLLLPQLGQVPASTHRDVSGMSLTRGKKFQVQPIEGVWHCLFWCNPRVPHDRSDALASVPAELSGLLPFIFRQLYVCHCLKMMFQCFSWKVCPMTSPKLQCAKSCEFQRCLSSSCWSGINTCYKLDRNEQRKKDATFFF